MANDAAALVQKFWNFCNVLRDDGVSYGDYVEQLTYLLFLKMAEEQRMVFPGRPTRIPPGLDWESLRREDGDALETHYRHILGTLGKEGAFGTDFPQIPEPDSRPGQAQTPHHPD
jgi:type I restriction enzyme M protein